jgi:predicted Rossmann fold flavoprotein
VRRVLRAFPVADTVAFFDEIGVRLREETGGKLFPVTGRARDVLQALLGEARRVGAELAAGQRVLEIDRSADRFRIVTAAHEVFASHLVLATGGQALPRSGSDGAGYAFAQRFGHTIVPVTPALAPLVLDASDDMHATLSGVAHDVELTLRVDGALAVRLAGALLWTHFGISGPVVLNASRHWLRAQLEGRAAALTANFCPGRQFDDLDDEWQTRARSAPRASVHTTLATVVPASAAAAILRRLGIDGAITLAHLARDDRRRLVRALVEWPLPVVASRGYTHAEATAGGVALAEIDAATMRSRVCPGLSIVGEVLDVDGKIGGFNFQWAWSTGFVAGRALAKGAARA